MKNVTKVKAIKTGYVFNLTIKGPRFKAEYFGPLEAKNEAEVADFTELFFALLKKGGPISPPKPAPGMVAVRKDEKK